MDKETPKTFNTCDLPKNFIEAATKESLRIYQRKPKHRICGALRDLVSFVQFKKREACNFTKSNTPPWVFFTFFKLYEWYQIAKTTTHPLIVMLCHQ